MWVEKMAGVEFRKKKHIDNGDSGINGIID